MVRLTVSELAKRTVKERAEIARVDVRRRVVAVKVDRVFVSKVGRFKGKTIKISKTTPERLEELKAPIPLSVSRPTGKGEVTIVTRSGKVTVKRDGRTVEQFQATPESTKRFLQREGVAIRREVKEIFSKSDVESREKNLERLIKGKVLTVEGREGAKRELASIRREKDLGRKVTRLEQLQTSVTIKRAQRQSIKNVLSSIGKAEVQGAFRKRTLIQQKALSKIIVFETKLLTRREKLIKRNIEANRIAKRFKEGKGDTRDVRKALKLGLVTNAQLALLSIPRTGSFFARLAVTPVTTVKAQVRALTVDLPKTVKQLRLEFIRDPLGVVGDFIVFSKVAGFVGRGVKRSPIGFALQKELFLIRLPKDLRFSARKILNAAVAQKKINPLKLKDPKKINFVKPKDLTRIEFNAVLKTLRSKKVDSVVFGSEAAAVVTKKIKPKDIDIATSDIAAFSREFINNLPKKARRDIVLRGQKVIDKRTGRKLLDIKPLSRLHPGKNLFGKAFLPIAGLRQRIVFKVKTGELLPSKLPEFKPSIVQGALEIGVEKVIKVKGVKITGFGEQTLRKALGTLQVLIEKNVRRAKDPQSLLVSLKLQLSTIKGSKPKTVFGRSLKKSRVIKLRDAIRLLQSKRFAKLLDSKVPGLTRDFPLVSRINVKNLRGITKKGVQRAIAKFKKSESLKRIKISELPSRLPSKLPSRLPSRLSKIPISKIPIKPFKKVPVKKRFKFKALKRFKFKKVVGKKPQLVRFTPTIVRPKKIVRDLRLFTGAELR